MKTIDEIFKAYDKLSTLDEFKAEWQDAWRIELIKNDLRCVQRQISALEISLSIARKLESEYSEFEAACFILAGGEWRNNPFAINIERTFGERAGILRDEMAPMEKKRAALKRKEKRLLKKLNQQ